MATLLYGPLQTTEVNMGPLKFETRLGDDVITSGIAEELEHFQDISTTDARDQHKCAELLASLRYGEEEKVIDFLQRRPKTAMPSLGMPDILHVTRPYETTYQREYVPRPDTNVVASRPKSASCLLEPETVPQRPLVTKYQAEFYAKDERPATPIRSGSSSGNRANKPHPPKSFLIWKFPSKSRAYPDTSPLSEELTNEKLNQVTKRLCKSTYQSDYLGIPQGFQVKSAYGRLPSDWKGKVPYSLDSLQRDDYRTPIQQPEHLVAVNRYGSNRLKHQAVNGVIPTANTRLLDIKTRTTYDRHYNDLAPEVALKARDPTRLMVAEANRLQNERPFLPETKQRDSVSRLMEEMEREGGAQACPASSPPVTPYRPPSSASQKSGRLRPRVPSATPVTNYGGYAYDPVLYKRDNGPSPALSHISAPYSPPFFLG